jgi:mRNA interferase MazF
LNNYKAGDVVEVDLNPTIGAEKNKVRPCLIIEGGLTPLELVIVLPITDAKQKNSPIFVSIIDLKIAGLKKPSVVDTYQIRAISTKRVIRKLGHASKQEMFKIRFNLARILSIDEAHL